MSLIIIFSFHHLPENEVFYRNIVPTKLQTFLPLPSFQFDFDQSKIKPPYDLN